MQIKPGSDWSGTLEEIHQEIAVNALRFALLCIGLLGLLCLSIAVILPLTRWITITSLSCFVLVLLGWLLHRWSYPAAAWLVTVSSFLLTWGAILYSGIGASICLLALVTAMALLLISRPIGLMAAALSTLGLLALPGIQFGIDPYLKGIILVLIWGVTGLFYFSMHSLVQTVQWSWYGYTQNQSALRTAQDFQVQLLQTVEELKASNEQLTRLNRLAQSLRQEAEEERMAKEQFVANVSHELRTPLNMIIGFCDMITRNPEMYGKRIKPSLLADLKVILRNSQHLSELIDDVLDLSKIEARQFALSKEYISMPEVIEAAVTAVHPLYRSKGLYLETELEPGIPVLFADRTRIREVIINLLSNAGRFTEQGGVRVHAWQKDDRIQISVSDTGPGIAPEDQDRVFEPFQQLDGSLRRRYGGTGLGLSISRKIVEMHEGSMWIESSLGNGATFSFSLPVVMARHPAGGMMRWFSPFLSYEDRHVGHSTMEPAQYHPRLVVVEQGKTLSRLLQRYADGTQIDRKATLEEALLDLNENPASALLINNSSLDITAQPPIHPHQLPYGVPAMIFSIPESETAASTMGVVKYLVKPIARDELVASLSEAGENIQTILIADDEQDAQQLYARILNETAPQYRVLRALDGRQALEILRQQHVDLLLLDLTMPEIDGFQVLAAVRQDPSLAHLPVIITSARDPLGQPVVSSALTVFTASGLSSRDVLACVEVLSRILAKTAPAENPMFSITPPA
jgi:signal transduction histidine kinase/CheY-like chemotaxis protein